MYLTVSIGQSHTESLTGFSQAHPSSNGVSSYFTRETFPLLPTHFFFIRTLKTIEKQIHILPFPGSDLGLHNW